MSIQTAKKCFEENLRLFGNAQSQPEKHNLYKGLYQLADAVEDLQRAAETLSQNQRTIQNSINSLRNS